MLRWCLLLGLLPLWRPMSSMIALDGIITMIQDHLFWLVISWLGGRCIWAGRIKAEQFVLYDITRLVFHVASTCADTSDIQFNNCRLNVLLIHLEIKRNTILLHSSDGLVNSINNKWLVLPNPIIIPRYVRANNCTGSNLCSKLFY
jgi:uncharacterized protein involved in response to NO